ncbi:DUF898 family protein [Chitinophaga sp. SYP-B3965]|uniref:YjgN family protein n=1 Tax=Chitinophaga sp. SYP-B3965 TaxID=2663120 RepID=UPI00129984AF|nr:DUF898 family protein [Chitinophaga sp. SYP-B3965]MRG45068.1 DUF898 family protein [Chitinophaga sp. SYP-B3965]
MQQPNNRPADSLNTPSLTFHGSGETYFGILIVNMLLTIVTLGFYYPWARAKELQFFYSNTEMEGSPFSWNGTGAEIFKGFIKAVGIFLALIAVNVIFRYLKIPVVGMVFYILSLILLIPIAIHGANRYHWSRTSWRSIRFGYRGDRNEFVKLFIKEILLTIVTIGIYGSWAAMNIRNYILGNLRFGSGEFTYEGDGWEFFKMNIKGYFLTLFTLGIYFFWWQADAFRYSIDKLRLLHGNKSYNFQSKATGGAFAGLLIVNMLIFIFTLGFGYAWVQVRTIKFIFANVEIDGDIALVDLQQTEEEYRNALGEDLADMMDLSVI